MQQHFSLSRQSSVGARIRALRKERNLTQTELSEKIGILQSDLSRMEKGEYKVGLDTLFKILGVFELDMASFFDDGIPSAEDDRQLWKDFLALDEESRHEVRDFIRFKMSQRKGDAGE
ncbi:MAG TPA: helix-turn-helix transcriptional regulator [Thermoanaerobaculia bacterium]|nr:helix-turn-helix transcriptional regulator [Thermoanaerobaculia bacterium]